MTIRRLPIAPVVILMAGLGIPEAFELLNAGHDPVSFPPEQFQQPRRGIGHRPGGRPQGGRGPARDAAPRVWQPKAPAKSDNLSFEDMMSRFKSQSEEKMADLDHETNNRRGGGYAPRGRRGSR